DLHSLRRRQRQMCIRDRHIFCSVTAAYSHLPPILDRFRVAHPSVEIKLSTGDAADAMETVSYTHLTLPTT
ncbi:hypothetical protein ELP73_29155, partial [Klebsiella pneumoniae]|nr:hypothetical protein [Klebsiella pneumoniae]